MPPKIPAPTSRTTDLIRKLGRALELFRDAKQRREEAQKTITAKKFEIGDLTRNSPRVTSDIKELARHESAVENAQAAVKEATKVFLSIDGEVGKAAADVWALHSELSAAARLELEPVQRRAVKRSRQRSVHCWTRSGFAPR